MACRKQTERVLTEAPRHGELWVLNRMAPQTIWVSLFGPLRELCGSVRTLLCRPQGPELPPHKGVYGHAQLSLKEDPQPSVCPVAP